jgi:hypothetical protein
MDNKNKGLTELSLARKTFGARARPFTNNSLISQELPLASSLVPLRRHNR